MSNGRGLVRKQNLKFILRLFITIILAKLISTTIQPTYAKDKTLLLTNKRQNEQYETLLSNRTRTTTVLNTLLKNCTEPAINEFPKDLFTQSQRRHGAIVFHLLAACYVFIATALVVNDYFIAALDKLCAKLGLDEDIAGATFMAGGSSSPELFIALIGIFIAKGDVGVGTIVGSAVFNIVCVIGICGLFVTGAVKLTWWPLCRDSLFYALSIMVLVVRFDNDDINFDDNIQQQHKIPIDDLIAMSRFAIDFETAVLKIMMTRHFRSKTRFRMAARFVITEMRLRQGQGESRPQKPATERRFSFYQGRTPSLLAVDEDYQSWKDVPNWKYESINFVKWLGTLPIKLLFYLTIPDCRNPR
ncbi:unnamed protein product [Didymodactylos carnosus]|nr:unnamed protein product [Didymodactylos carnosus]CAF3781395.1 unnamed protein product [Didymodactylos carnosus]